MSKEKWQMVFLIIGIPLMVLMLVSAFKPKKKRVLSPPPGPVNLAPSPAAGPAPAVFVPADANVLESQKKNAEKPWGRDPFVADPYKAGQASELRLQGISYRKDNVGYAFINNEIVRQKDTVLGYEVVEVLKDKVLLKKGSESFYLTFPEEGVTNRINR